MSGRTSPFLLMHCIFKPTLRFAPGESPCATWDLYPGSMLWYELRTAILAEVENLAPEKCKELELRDFQTNSWKRMPAPRDLVIGNVEILTNISAKGYTKWPNVSHE